MSNTLCFNDVRDRDSYMGSEFLESVGHGRIIVMGMRENAVAADVEMVGVYVCQRVMNDRISKNFIGISCVCGDVRSRDLVCVIRKRRHVVHVGHVDLNSNRDGKMV